jgi:hypothetical protein
MRIARKTTRTKKELRIWFTPEHYERLEKQASRMDMTMAALVRYWAMEKVSVLEGIGAQSGVLDQFRIMQEQDKKPSEEEKTRE